jgi:hypothetical protein
MVQHGHPELKGSHGRRARDLGGMHSRAITRGDRLLRWKDGSVQDAALAHSSEGLGIKRKIIAVFCLTRKMRQNDRAEAT